MRITGQRSGILTLSGVPGGAGWMAAMMLIGVVILGACATLFLGHLVALRWWAVMLMAFGAVLGGVLAWVGADRLLTVESLTLDRHRSAGDYAKRHRLLPRGESMAFSFDLIDSIHLVRREVFSPDSEGGGTNRSIHWCAELRLTSPNRTVLLAESQNDREASVRPVATGVAAFLDLPLAVDLDGDAETTSAEDVGVPIARRTTGGPIEIVDPPEGSRIVVVVDESAPRVHLSWKALANGCLVWPLLVLGLSWTTVSALFLLGILGVIPAGGVAPGQSVVVLAVFDGVLILIGVALVALSVYLLAWASRTVTITPDAVRVRAPLGIGSATLPIGSITSVRTSKADDAVLISAGKRRARVGVHLPADGELKWLGATIRGGIEAMGSAG